jgi:hypothetical protein
MRRPVLGLGSLALLAVVLSAVPTSAQWTSAGARPVGPMAYDVAKETTITGTVSSVLAKPAAGMLMGSHLLLTSASGNVDASLGLFGLRGKGALSVQSGQAVAITGVMKTVNGKQVFMARTVKVGGQVYAIRNEHGIPVTPQARLRAAAQPDSSAKKGFLR